VLEVAERVAQIPTDIVQLNKRSVHRAMDTMGLRAAIRSGTELSALAVYQATFQKFIAEARDGGLTKALSDRDEAFSDYRTTEG
jgi:enoyl-CoA hydratase